MGGEIELSITFAALADHFEQLAIVVEHFDVVGVGVCDHTEEVHYEGVDLVIGYNFDHDECHRNSPAHLEVISITHRGQDITGLIDLLGGPAGFDKIADLLEGDK